MTTPQKSAHDVDALVAVSGVEAVRGRPSRHRTPGPSAGASPLRTRFRRDRHEPRALVLK
ncbi:hypothetical protein [Streptomyces sp. NPDC003943]